MKVRNLTAVAAMTVIICVCSWIAIPVAIPFTMQTFAVFTALYLLGGKLGTASIALYILMGAVGLPVFAGFQGGLGHLLGPTGGYILGFLTHGLIYLIGEQFFRIEGVNADGTGKKSRINADSAGKRSSTYTQVVFQILGLISCYIFGTLWYILVAGNEKGFLAVAAICVLPYIIPDLLKLWLAGFVTARIKKHIVV